MEPTGVEAVACAIINAHREHLFLALTPERDKWFDRFCSDATFTGALPPAEPLNESRTERLIEGSRQVRRNAISPRRASCAACLHRGHAGPKLPRARRRE